VLKVRLSFDSVVAVVAVVAIVSVVAVVAIVSVVSVVAVVSVDSVVAVVAVVSVVSVVAVVAELVEALSLLCHQPNPYLSVIQILGVRLHNNLPFYYFLKNQISLSLLTPSFRAVS